MRSVISILVFLVLVLFEACSTSKYVAEDEMLLDDIKIEVDGNYPDINVGQLKSYVHQRGNSRWFGAFKGGRGRSETNRGAICQRIVEYNHLFFFFDF